jgi:hypothetical protein
MFSTITHAQTLSCINDGQFNHVWKLRNPYYVGVVE